jgi:hypothetical protein
MFWKNTAARFSACAESKFNRWSAQSIAALNFSLLELLSRRGGLCDNRQMQAAVIAERSAC